MRAHYAAVLARLRAATALADKVHDTALTDAGGLPVVGTYAVLYGGSPDVLGDDRLAVLQSLDADAEYVYTVRSVSPSADGVRSVQDKVAGQLVGHALVIAGRSCRTEMTDVSDVEPDKSRAIPLYFADQEFTVNSSRI